MGQRASITEDGSRQVWSDAVVRTERSSPAGGFSRERARRGSPPRRPDGVQGPQA